MRSRSRSYRRGSRSNLVRGDLRFEADPSPDDDELLPELGPDPGPPPEDVPPAPESLDPEGAPVIEPVAESSRDDPEPPPPPPPPPPPLTLPVAPLTLPVAPLTLPVALVTVPATFSAASLTVPVTPAAASPTLFVRSEACPVGDVAVETAELSVSPGSSWPPAAALPDSPPKTSEATKRMRIAAEVILLGRYPPSLALNRPKAVIPMSRGTGTRRKLSAG